LETGFCANPRVEYLTLHTGLAYNQRHSVADMCPVQGAGVASAGVNVAGCQNFCVVNGDSSQQGSDSTTPLAFDYETRSCMQLVFLPLPTPTMLVGVGRIFESVCLSVCLQHNSKTNDPNVFKLGVGNDLGIP